MKLFIMEMVLFRDLNYYEESAVCGPMTKAAVYYLYRSTFLWDSGQYLGLRFLCVGLG